MGPALSVPPQVYLVASWPTVTLNALLVVPPGWLGSVGKSFFLEGSGIRRALLPFPTRPLFRASPICQASPPLGEPTVTWGAVAATVAKLFLLDQLPYCVLPRAWTSQ